MILPSRTPPLFTDLHSVMERHISRLQAVALSGFSGAPMAKERLRALRARQLQEELRWKDL